MNQVRIYHLWLNYFTLFSDLHLSYPNSPEIIIIPCSRPAPIKFFEFLKVLEYSPHFLSKDFFKRIHKYFLGNIFSVTANYLSSYRLDFYWLIYSNLNIILDIVYPFFNLFYSLKLSNLTYRIQPCGRPSLKFIIGGASVAING